MDSNLIKNLKYVSKNSIDIYQIFFHPCNFKSSLYFDFILNLEKKINTKKMDKRKDLQQFLMQKINEIDENMAKQNEDITKLRMATMRTTYAKVIQSLN